MHSTPLQKGLQFKCVGKLLLLTHYEKDFNMYFK